MLYVHLKIQQLHYMEEKAKADFDDLVTRTSNHEALQVFLHTTISPYLTSLVPRLLYKANTYSDFSTVGM